MEMLSLCDKRKSFILYCLDILFSGQFVSGSGSEAEADMAEADMAGYIIVDIM